MLFLPSKKSNAHSGDACCLATNAYFLLLRQLPKKMLGRKLANKITLVALSVGGEQINKVCMWCGMIHVCLWAYMHSWGG